MSHSRVLILGLFALAGLGATVARAQTAADKSIVLAPHRAIYDISLERSSSGSSIVDVSGRMVYELTGSTCEGYTQNMRFVTRMANSEGTAQLNDLRSSSYEDASGKTFRFNSNSYKDETLTDTTQGDAAREGGSIDVELTRPKKKTFKLATGVYFPVQHSVALIAAAQAGKTIFIGDLYDGSEKGEKVYSTTTAIGKRVAPGAVKSPAVIKNADLLDKHSFWPVSISYFEPGSEKKDSVPSYELAFRFYDNGVSTKLVIDYGEFAIKGELKELAFLDAPKCDSPPPPTKAPAGKR